LRTSQERSAARVKTKLATVSTRGAVSRFNRSGGRGASSNKRRATDGRPTSLADTAIELILSGIGHKESRRRDRK
jgi:hypothetical protein